MNKENTIFLWKEFVNGEKKAFAYFYNEYVDILFKYGTKLCKRTDIVKDSIQEVFIDLYLKRKKNKCNPENLKYYLMLALKRNIIKKIRKLRKREEEDVEEYIFETQYSIEKCIIKDEKEKELNRKINRVLKALPTRQKEALYLRFNEGIEYKEIADIMEISVESVRKQVYRALENIREKFSKKIITFFMIWGKIKKIMYNKSVLN